jgi:Ca2+-binding RTX toxin-like protein
MPARNGLLRRLKVLPVVALATLAATAASASAQAPGLPRTFNAKAIDSPEPRGGGSFGWGLASADLNGDGKLDLLVPQSQDSAATRVYVFDGATGSHIDTIAPPELNPGGADPILAFTYVETMPDLGSCPSGDGADAGKICDDALIGPPDGIPEIIVGSRGKRVNATDPSIDAVGTDPALGRGYVIDGKTRAVLKRIDMPAADRATQQALNASPQFGRVMASPQALPPCAGSPAENNNQGVGPCPSMPRVSRIGDLDGGGQPDIVITARNFVETPAQAAAGSQCRAAAAGNCTSGKAWAYRGELIAGTDPQAILDTAMYAIQNPLAQTGGQEFGGNLYRVGDLNTNVVTTDCDATPTNATCAPEFVIPARNLSYPFANPTAEFSGVGAAFLINGRTGAFIVPPGASASQPAITSPEPQKLSQFSGSFNGGRAVGDLGASTLPDILLPAALQNAGLTDDGKFWVFNGVGGGGGATGSWQFASMTDPTPVVGGNFGGSFTGVGDLVSGTAAPANELLVGGFRFDPFTEAADNVVADVHFVNPQTATNLMTIPNPTGARGDGFGVGLVPMGDLNGDGFLDFAASSYLASINVGGDGRAFIFYSDNSPLPPPPTTAAPQVTGPAVPQPAAATEQLLSPGTCANRTIGTEGGERIRGTIAGDEIFGFGGNDSISGYQGRDCIDGAAGDDRLYGGDDNDKLVGGSGNDRLHGQDARDELFGGSSADRLDGGAGNDMLAGGSNNDDMLGGSGNDRIFGESGNDRIVGGGGRNMVDAGSGNDSVEARNGERDRIICGSGRDRVHADRYDRLNGCEIVTTGGKISNRSVLPPRVTASSAKASGGKTR